MQENAALKFEHCVITASSDKPAYTVRADEFHFYNIAYNIVENAIKYGAEKPVVAISVQQEEAGIVLRFEDNGPGIPDAHIDYVFERFYRVPRESKKEVEGFGIGLFYVKKICELHKWKIAIANNPNGGITVAIHIPKSSMA